MPDDLPLDPEETYPEYYADGKGFWMGFHNPLAPATAESQVRFFAALMDDADRSVWMLDDLFHGFETDSSLVYEELPVLPERMAKVDYRRMANIRLNSGAFRNEVMLLGFVYRNFAGAVIVNQVSYAELSADELTGLRAYLRDAGYHYASLITGKLPLPKKDQVNIPMPTPLP
jgi:hypothetical protein